MLLLVVIPAIAFLPVCAGVAVAGIPAVASVPADPGLPILAGVFKTVCTKRHNRLSDYHSYQTVTFL